LICYFPPDLFSSANTTNRNRKVAVLFLVEEGLFEALRASGVGESTPAASRKCAGGTFSAQAAGAVLRG